MSSIWTSSLDDFLWSIMNEYDGFKYKSTLTTEQLRVKMAEYAVACMHDTHLAQEAEEVIRNKGVV